MGEKDMHRAFALIILSAVAASPAPRAHASAIVTPPVALSEANAWHDLFVDGLDAGLPAVAAPGTLDFWTISVSNTSGLDWEGFRIRFSQDSGGTAMSFVTHFEPSFTSGAWTGYSTTLDGTFDLADFDAPGQGAPTLLSGGSTTISTPAFNPTDASQTYHLQIMAIAPVPSPGAFVLLMIAAAIPIRRGSRRSPSTK